MNSSEPSGHIWTSRMTIRRSEIAVRARAFLGKVRSPDLTDAEFDVLVQKEIDLSVKQVRANGRTVTED